MTGYKSPPCCGSFSPINTQLIEVVVEFIYVEMENVESPWLVEVKSLGQYSKALPYSRLFWNRYCLLVEARCETPIEKSQLITNASPR